ncbi:hypothetical protein KSS87_016017 [Heliosperma pusillum]|nr:hypothetical protein KSS87_019012 [Heliosperma pusillum]KAH9620364.1 hypothetical protein KSS87_016017 [Heliosperma pusillum]
MESSDSDDTPISPPPPSPSTSSSSTVTTLFSTTSAESSSSSSGEITLTLTAADIPPPEPPYLPPPSTAAREKCVGRQDKVSWGFTTVIGRRSEMEDAVAVVPAFISRACEYSGGCTAEGSRTSGDVSPLHFFAVYDGHGGSEVADFCAKRMHEVVAEELNREGRDGNEWQKKWQEAFCNGFRRADDEVITKAVASDMVGSTAVVAVVSGCQIILSNCGDSRAVLCKRRQTIPLTVDHKPDRADELSRIEGEGGRVINWYGARVLGVLAMSRAIGDRYMSPYIIPVPETTFTTRSEEDECLILASDGLWDVMSNEKVGNVARRVLRKIQKSEESLGDKSPAQVVADTLTQLAISLNSSDNISVLVVDLRLRRRRVQANNENAGIGAGKLLTAIDELLPLFKSNRTDAARLGAALNKVISEHTALKLHLIAYMEVLFTIHIVY